MSALLQLLITIFGMLTYALAQSTAPAASEQVWGSVVFTVPGDAPLVNTPATLSSVGVKQALAAGEMIRQRYIEGKGDNITSVYPIARLAANSTKEVMDHKLLDILSTDDQPTVGTALSFLQGLYPPLTNRGDGNMIQWPSIKAVTKDDYKFNWLSGASECPKHQVNGASYTSTDAYITTQAATYHYYQSLAPLFPDLPKAYLTYKNAPTIASLASYLRTNNATFATQLSQADVNYLRYLASSHVWDNYGRYSQGKQIPVMGGRMLAGKILGQLTSQISSATTGAPLSLLFGPSESLVSLYSLSGLAAKAEFHQIPLPGSVMVFEVFSDVAADPVQNRVLLDSSRLYVRALIRNGTAGSESLHTVPLFYRGTAASKMPWREFDKEMTRIAVQSPADWCTQCESFNIFCPGFVAGNDPSKNVGGAKDCPQASLGKGCGAVSPTAAGFIGAMVATVLFIVAIVMLATCSGGFAAWRKKPSHDGAEAGAARSETTDSTSKLKYFNWLKRSSISKPDSRIPDPDVPDRSPDGKTHSKTNSWELRDTAPVSPVSPLSDYATPVATTEAATEERLRSRKDYTMMSEDQVREEEDAAAGLRMAVPRENV